MKSTRLLISAALLMTVSSNLIARTYKCLFKSNEIKAFFDATKVKYRGSSGRYLLNINAQSCYSFDTFTGADVLSCSLNQEVGVLIEQGKKKENGVVLSLITGETLSDAMDCKF